MQGKFHIINAGSWEGLGSGKARIARVPVLVIAAVGIAGCMPVGYSAVGRVEREFSCPSYKIGMLKRDDISPGLVDVDACGQRARYMCVRRWECVREPDPVRWDPDPALCLNPDRVESRPAGCFMPARGDS
jgi:hypothetical protein